MEYEMVEVFKTNIEEVSQARHLTSLLQYHFPYCRIVFDLEDCDRVLKIAGQGFDPDEVLSLVQSSGFCCQILE